MTKKEKPKEDTSNLSKNKGRGLKRCPGTSSKNIKKDEEIDITEIPEVVNPEDIDLTKPNDEEREEKKKSGINKRSKGSKASKTKDKVKPKADIEPEKSTEAGKE